MTRYGGTPEEWAAWKKLAKVDLLPAVGNPHAEISPHSKMKGVGKTPSLYNDERQARGFTDWTDHETTVLNIETWQKEPDYSICVQTRRIRGLDIDVPDQALSDAIRDDFLEQLDMFETLPTRFRNDSGKQLLAFVCAEALGKRSFVVKEWVDEETGKTKRWIVELLADGQQFVAAGTHPSGARYEWDGGPPVAIPAISLEELNDAWAALVAKHALGGVDRQAARRDPTLLEDLDTTDPVTTFLVESDWPTYTYERGMLYVECPNADSHSSDNGETQTAWLAAGTGKYRNGHFRCMHAGCSHITDDKFFQAVGYRPAKADDFEDLSTGDAEAALYAKLAASVSPKPMAQRVSREALMGLPLPGFIRDNMGRIETCLENVVRGLRAYKAAECEIAYDEFRGELMLAEDPGAWRPLGDADTVRLRIRLEAIGFKNLIGKEMMRDALVLVGDERTFDSAREWLLTVVPEWDGVSRIRRFYPDYMQTEDSRYTQAMGDYIWTAHAARVLDPGCQVDMVPVLVGAEGLRKTSALKAMAPAKDFYGEFNLKHEDVELSRQMRGKLVGELAELRGVSSRDGESIKAWITRTDEEWTPKYKEYGVKLARRVVFQATSNDDGFLEPHMGERRWGPMMVLRMIDTDKIVADRLQLWAEARDIYQAEGLQWAEAERLAKTERDAFRNVDAWQARVEAWGNDELEPGGPTPFNSGTLRSEEVLTQCLGISAERIKKADQMRVSAVLTRAGMTRIQGWVGQRNVKVWVQAKVDREVDRIAPEVDRNAGQ